MTDLLMTRLYRSALDGVTAKLAADGGVVLLWPPSIVRALHVPHPATFGISIAGDRQSVSVEVAGGGVVVLPVVGVTDV